MLVAKGLWWSGGGFAKSPLTKFLTQTYQVINQTD